MHKLLLCSAVALSLGACTTEAIENATSTIEGDIQSGTSLLCGVVPTLASITSVVAAVVGQVEITTLSAAAEQAIENDICSAAPAKTSARYKALPLRSAAAAAIGVTQSGVAVRGWRL